MTGDGLGTILHVQIQGILRQEGASRVTVQEVIRALEAAGWETTNADDQLHRLQHEARLVTIAGKLELSVPPGVQRILWKHAQVEETD